MPTRRSALGLLAAAPVLALSRPAFAASRPVFSADGVAINGYDPVAYFNDAMPVPGMADIAVDWRGATWRFADGANRDAFMANPQAYAPRYGGYCAYAVANGATASTVPEAWTVHDGRLYLNFSTRVRTVWKEDIPGNITKADANWPAVLG